MNSKFNRPIKTKKPIGTPKVQQASLKSESNKIQSKLQSLRAQIAMRKTQKSNEQGCSGMKNPLKSTTSQSWNTAQKQSQKGGSQAQSGKSGQNWQISSQKINKFLLSSTKSGELYQVQGNTQPNTIHDRTDEDKNKFEELLQHLKMSQYREVIGSQYGVRRLSGLLELREEDIDTWKSVPVGFRIKLRKIINQHKSNSNRQQQFSPQKVEADIEQIIKRRQTQKQYQAITNKQFDEQQPQQNNNNIEQILATEDKQKMSKQLSEPDDQDILISSLNSAFMQRRGIIKKEKSSQDIGGSRDKHKVQWDANVQEFNKETSNFRGQKFMTKYPSKQNQSKTTTNSAYCWNCLKKITQKSGQKQENRQFCSLKCHQIYKNMTQLKEIQSLIQDVKIEQPIVQKPTKREQSYDGEQEEEGEEDIEEVDLGIL